MPNLESNDGAETIDAVTANQLHLDQGIVRQLPLHQ